MSRWHLCILIMLRLRRESRAVDRWLDRLVGKFVFVFRHRGESRVQWSFAVGMMIAIWSDVESSLGQIVNL